jgi:hypothetical protein
MRQGSIRLRAFAPRDFQFVAQIDGGDAEEFFIGLNAAFDFGFQVVCCGDSARFQRTSKCAGQSTGQRRDDVIDRGRQRCGVLHAIILRIIAMRAEAQRLIESFNVRVAEWPLLLYQPNSRGVNDLAHKHLLSLVIPTLQKKIQRKESFYLSY